MMYFLYYFKGEYYLRAKDGCSMSNLGTSKLFLLSFHFMNLWKLSDTNGRLFRIVM